MAVTVLLLIGFFLLIGLAPSGGNKEGSSLYSKGRWLVEPGLLILILYFKDWGQRPDLVESLDGNVSLEEVAG